MSPVVIRFITRCHSLSFVVTRSTTRCHSLSLDVPLVRLIIRNHLWVHLFERFHFHIKSISRSSRAEVFYKKGVFENFTKFTGKHLCRHRCFPVNFVKFLRAPSFTKHLHGCFYIYFSFKKVGCLKLIIKTMFINPVWLIFHRHNLILEKEKKRWKKDKYIITWK